jgi:hypothetical protein
MDYVPAASPLALITNRIIARLLRLHKSGSYQSEADMTEIYEYTP